MYKTFEDKPDLKKVLVEGTAGISKLSRITKIATKENQAELAVRAQVDSKRVLQTIAKDENEARARARAEERGQLFEETPKLNPSLSKEVIEELNRLHEQKQDVNVILLNLLKQRNQRTNEKIEEVHERLSGETHLPATRYKNKEIQELLHEKYGGKCAFNGCTKPAEQIHHKVPFGLQSLHDPAFMVPLCKEHHRLAHSIDLKFASHLHSAQERKQTEAPLSRDPYQGFSTLD
jgi:hypothetical protein